MKQEVVTRYGAVSQTLHWVTAILVLIAFIFGPGGSEHSVYSAARDGGRQLHETLGLSVLTLAFLRVAWLAFAVRPPVPEGMAWMALAAKLVQGALYLLLFAVPMMAIAGAWLEGHPLTLIAGVKISPLVAPSHDLGATIARIHGWLGDIILSVAGLHAAAALFHHYVIRDGVLVSMLPRWFPLRLPGSGDSER